MDWELRVAEHEARHSEYVQDSVTVAAVKRMMTAEMAERLIEGSNTYFELRSRVICREADDSAELSAHGRWRSWERGYQGSSFGKRRRREDTRSENQTTGRITWRFRRRIVHWNATTAEARDTQRDCADTSRSRHPSRRWGRRHGWGVVGGGWCLWGRVGIWPQWCRRRRRWHFGNRMESTVQSKWKRLSCM